MIFRYENPTTQLGRILPYGLAVVHVAARGVGVEKSQWAMDKKVARQRKSQKSNMCVIVGPRK